VRYEPNGTVTVIADTFQGKRLNSPNDLVVHPDGGIWFTDPMYGIRGNYEGFKGESETFRRRETEPAVHGRQPVAVRGLRRNDRRAHRVAHALRTSSDDAAVVGVQSARGAPSVETDYRPAAAETVTVTSLAATRIPSSA
jgi:hypothetical protein